MPLIYSDNKKPVLMGESYSSQWEEFHKGYPIYRQMKTNLDQEKTDQKNLITSIQEKIKKNQQSISELETGIKKNRNELIDLDKKIDQFKQDYKTLYGKDFDIKTVGEVKQLYDKEYKTLLSTEWNKNIWNRKRTNRELAAIRPKEELLQEALKTYKAREVAQDSFTKNTDSLNATVAQNEKSRVELSNASAKLKLLEQVKSISAGSKIMSPANGKTELVKIQYLKIEQPVIKSNAN